MRYFEDFKPGEVLQLGHHAITRDEIVTFARQFDPQPFHIDEDAARETMFGGLIASGWHTGSLMMRLFCDGLIKDTASLGSPGIDEMRWIKPVRPGDTLALRVTTTECVPSRSKPDRGIVRSLLELHNQHGELVVSIRGMNLIRRR